MSRSRIVDEATRLRKLGYTWEQAFDMAEIMVALHDLGFGAMPSDDIEQILETGGSNAVR